LKYQVVESLLQKFKHADSPLALSRFRNKCMPLPVLPVKTGICSRNSKSLHKKGFKLQHQIPDADSPFLYQIFINPALVKQSNCLYLLEYLHNILITVVQFFRNIFFINPFNYFNVFFGLRDQWLQIRRMH
jgi:hypothetical protein